MSNALISCLPIDTSRGPRQLARAADNRNPYQGGPQLHIHAVSVPFPTPLNHPYSTVRESRSLPLRVARDPKKKSKSKPKKPPLPASSALTASPGLVEYGSLMHGIVLTYTTTGTTRTEPHGLVRRLSAKKESVLDSAWPAGLWRLNGLQRLRSITQRAWRDFFMNTKHSTDMSRSCFVAAEKQSRLVKICQGSCARCHANNIYSISSVGDQIGTAVIIVLIATEEPWGIKHRLGISKPK